MDTSTLGGPMQSPVDIPSTKITTSTSHTIRWWHPSGWLPVTELVYLIVTVIRHIENERINSKWITIHIYVDIHASPIQLSTMYLMSV